MYNRYVDGLATWTPDDPGTRGWPVIVKHGYSDPPAATAS